MKNINKKVTLADLQDEIKAGFQGVRENIETNFARKSDITVMKNEVIRGTKVLLEEMDKKWDLVAEQYLGVTSGLDIVAREVAIVKEQVQLININLTVGFPRSRRRGLGATS